MIENLGKVTRVMGSLMEEAGIPVAPSPEDVADALWLAHYFDPREMSSTSGLEETPAPPQRPDAEGQERSSLPQPETDAGKALADREETEATNGPEAELPPSAGLPTSAELFLWGGEGRGAGRDGRTGTSVRVPGAQALPHKLDFCRSLRPLVLREPSRHRRVFDEMATVRSIAEEEIWLPVSEPDRERWLTAHLVMDRSRSMDLWLRLASELAQLLRWLGAFRDVRLWGLRCEDGHPLFYPGLHRREGTSHSPEGLVDALRRNLVLILTDCVTEAWHDGTYARMLQVLQQGGPVTLFQALPEHLWPRTALRHARPIRFSPLESHREVTDLAHRAFEYALGLRGSRSSTEVGARVPVVSLEPGAFRRWALWCSGRERWTPGFQFSIEGRSDAVAQEPLPRQRSSAERLETFWKTASPATRRLAYCAAASPAVTLPILRVIRESMVPQAGQSNEAELLLSGLLEIVRDAEDAEEVIYDFPSEVRNRLLDNLAKSDTLRTLMLEKVSNFIEQNLGHGASFRAALDDPAGAEGVFRPEQGPVARITAEILSRLGGEFARMVSGRPDTRDSVKVHSYGADIDSVQVTEVASGRRAGDKEIRAYLKRVVEETSGLLLGGVDPAVVGPERDTRLELQAIYTALLTEGQEAVKSEAMELDASERPRLSESRRVSALERLDRSSRLVLLGEPGTGKSTFVNFVALCLAGERLGLREANLGRLTSPLAKDDDSKEVSQRWSHGALMPVRVTLRDFAARGLPPSGRRATATVLWEFIVSELETAGLSVFAPHLKLRLHEGGGLLLLDGFDEVPEAEKRREQMRQAVMDFTASFPSCRVLLTGRTYAYRRQEWALPGFEAAVLASFTEGQVRRFVDGWYAHVGRLRKLTDSGGRAEALKRAIFGSERLQALAQRPLLLTLMASLHAWRGGSLPEKREELYSDAVDLLLDFWERQRLTHDAAGQAVLLEPSLGEYLKVDRSQVRRLLNSLAYAAHASQSELVGTAEVPDGDLVTGLLKLSRSGERRADAGDLLEYLRNRAGLLMPRGVGVQTFPHRTFQEYLAACHLTDHEFPDQVAELARQDPNRWREVALLAGAKAARGSAATVWQLAEALCFREPEAAVGQPVDEWGAHLAGQLLVESADLTSVTERHRPKLDRVRRWLVELLGSALPAVERATAGVNLARLGDPRKGVATVLDMEMCSVPAGEFLWQKKEKHSIDQTYWISRLPLSQAQYREFVAAGGYGVAQYWPEAQKAGVWKAGLGIDYRNNESLTSPQDFGEPFSLPNHPVVGVTWYEALAFTRWLTERLQGEGLLEGWEVRLPSEVEWVKAARGGTQIPADVVVLRRLGDVAASSGELAISVDKFIKNPNPRRLYPWGEELTPELANYDATDLRATSTVGCFPRGVSPYGCEEMSGNVWEWCSILEEDVSNDSLAESVLCGGSWANSARQIQIGEQLTVRRNYRDQKTGFRCVLVPRSDRA